MNSPLYIRCVRCELKSYNEMDIANKFCGRCKKLHSGPNEYELGPTPKSFTTGFSWTDVDGRSWHCMHRMAGHSMKPCESCTAIIDDPMSANAPENMARMIEACRAHLTLDERHVLHEAIDHHEASLIEEMLPHGGVSVSPEFFARILITCARTVLKKAKET